MRCLWAKKQGGRRIVVCAFRSDALCEARSERGMCRCRDFVDTEFQKGRQLSLFVCEVSR